MLVAEDVNERQDTGGRLEPQILVWDFIPSHLEVYHVTRGHQHVAGEPLPVPLPALPLPLVEDPAVLAEEADDAAPGKAGPGLDVHCRLRRHGPQDSSRHV